MVELLAPAGSKEAFYAAVENKADAIYLGGKQFGARAYANNFDHEDLKEMIKYAHLFDIRVYVTVNTIVFDEEIDELIEFLDFLYLNDCDGLIIQDLGVLNIIRNRYPDFEIHASTQMNIHSVEEALVLKDLGVKRIVVAREINLETIKKIKRATNLEIEVFIHGALCVSSSGNCYISSIIGKRSGNRGRCAQPCRLPYSLGEDSGYLISPKDLYSLPRIKELIEAGVDSLKIEGRMKRPEYVAGIIKSYRKAIDNYYYNTEFNLETEEIELRKLFNRDFTKGFLFDEKDEDYINKEASNHQGILIGKVISSNNKTVKIKLDYELNFGDSIRLVGNVSDAITVNQMYRNNELITEAKANDIVSLRSHVDNLDSALVYLTSANRQLKELEKSYLEPSRKINISGTIDLIDDCLRISLKYKNYRYSLNSSVKVENPKSTPTNERLIEQFRKTANTVFEFESLDLDIKRPIFISIKEVNELRRRALDNFREIISKKNKNRKTREFEFTKPDIINRDSQMIVKVRTFEQLQAALKYELKEIYITDKLLFDDLKTNTELDVYYVTPRASTVEEENDTNIVTSKLGNYKDYRTSVYMNTTNALAVNLLENLGAKSIGLSLEMSYSQIENLVNNYKKLFSRLPNLEFMVYGRYELMMLKYKFGLKEDELDGSKNLVDRKNYSFPTLLEDEYVKILNSKRVHLVDYVEKLKGLNISPIIDFTIETASEVEEVLDIYLKNNNKNLIDVTLGHINEGVL